MPVMPSSQRLCDMHMQSACDMLKSVSLMIVFVLSLFACVLCLLLILAYRGSGFGSMNLMLPFPLTVLEGRVGFTSSFTHSLTICVSGDQKLYFFVELARLIFLFTAAFFIKIYISVRVPVPCHFFLSIFPALPCVMSSVLPNLEGVCGSLPQNEIHPGRIICTNDVPSTSFLHFTVQSHYSLRLLHPWKWFLPQIMLLVV